jgi:hypothetical protein
MRTLLTSILWSTCIFATVVGLMPACGEGDDVDMGTDNGANTGNGNGNGSDGGGLLGGGPGGSNGGAGNGGPPDEGACGAEDCANHRGDQSFVEEGAPDDAEALFGSATLSDPGTDPDNEPAIVYPSHETMFPINVSQIRHEWSGGTNNDLFELRFEGPNTTVSVYTATIDWTPSEEAWDWIAESNRGESVSFTVRGLDSSSPDQAWQSEPIELLFSDAEVEGAIFYWSTGSKGIMRATVSDPVPVKFYTDPAATDSDTCVACHTLSRDGTRLAVGYGGEKLREVSVPDRSVIVPVGVATVDAGAAPMMPDPMDPMMPDPMDPMMPKPMMPKPDGMMAEGMASAWTTFSPDGELLLVAANGTLTLIDSDTGEPIGPNDGAVAIPEGTFATHPDWSALGDHVAITLGTKGGNKEIEGGSIALLPYDGTGFGAAEVIVESTGATDNNFFPVWSPDSNWIAYVNAAGKSKDAVSATLRLLDVDTLAVRTLTRVNERVNNVDAVLGIGNSMPTWAPSTKPGIFWLAFSSLRAYGTVRPQDDKEDQIWIAAIDPDLADASYAAFWAPFQSIEDGNHRAFWTHTAEDQQCSCVDVCGDNLDNDCNGTADEAACMYCAPFETCGDGIDNDCDCVVDECNQEVCGDDIDNDGDGLTDDEDPVCSLR